MNTMSSGRKLHILLQSCMEFAAFVFAIAAAAALSPSGIADFRLAEYLVLAAAGGTLIYAHVAVEGELRFLDIRALVWSTLRNVVVTTSVIAVGAALCSADLLLPKQFLLTFVVSLTGLLLASRSMSQAVLVEFRRNNRNLRTVLVVGSGALAERLLDSFQANPEYGYLAVAYVDDDFDGTRLNCNELKKLGELKELSSVLEQSHFDEVFITLPMRSRYDAIREAILLCEEQGIPVHLPADLFTLSIARASNNQLSETPMISILSAGPMGGARYVVKSSLDRCLATALLILLGPIMLAAAALIALTMGRPILYAQDRVGFRRHTFKCFKFRTMVTGAESQMDALQELNEADGPVFKIKSDPRVTPLGYWLRRLSIDELPQLFNVLLGSMSLVGPRPLPLRDVALFDKPSLLRRFAVKPGITCIWQVSGRSNTSFDDWIKLDLSYVDDWSLGLDFRILVRTAWVVLRGDGAY